MIYDEWQGMEEGCYTSPGWNIEGGVTAYSDFYSSNNKRKCEMNGPTVVSPIKLTDLGGFSICGKRGGKAFVDITRTNSQGECP